MQRRLCEQRCSTIASIRSCPARLRVCGTCGVYGLYYGLEMACVRSYRAWLKYVERAKRKLYMRTAKKRPRSFERER